MPWCKRSPLINKGIDGGIQPAYLTSNDKETEIFNYLLDYYVPISFYISEFLYVFFYTGRNENLEAVATHG
jgi:hypothetical protein